MYARWTLRWTLFIAVIVLLAGIIWGVLDGMWVIFAAGCSFWFAIHLAIYFLDSLPEKDSENLQILIWFCVLVALAVIIVLAIAAWSAWDTRQVSGNIEIEEVANYVLPAILFWVGGWPMISNATRCRRWWVENVKI